jgi:hypothetical protein
MGEGFMDAKQSGSHPAGHTSDGEGGWKPGVPENPPVRKVAEKRFSGVADHQG